MDRVTISESDLKKIIKKSIGKHLTESKSPKKNKIPEEVSNFLKQNPKLVIEGLMDTCGEDFYDFVGETYSKKKRGL